MPPSWDDAINAARQDSSYDLSQLTPEQAAKIFESKIDKDRIDKLIVELKDAIATNQANAVKLANVIAIVQTIVAVGKIIA